MTQQNVKMTQQADKSIWQAKVDNASDNMLKSVVYSYTYFVDHAVDTIEFTGQNSSTTAVPAVPSNTNVPSNTTIITTNNKENFQQSCQVLSNKINVYFKGIVCDYVICHYMLNGQDQQNVKMQKSSTDVKLYEFNIPLSQTPQLTYWFTYLETGKSQLETSKYVLAV